MLIAFLFWLRLPDGSSTSPVGIYQTLFSIFFSKRFTLLLSFMFASISRTRVHTTSGIGLWSFEVSGSSHLSNVRRGHPSRAANPSRVIPKSDIADCKKSDCVINIKPCVSPLGRWRQYSTSANSSRSFCFDTSRFRSTWSSSECPGIHCTMSSSPPWAKRQLTMNLLASLIDSALGVHGIATALEGEHLRAIRPQGAVPLWIDVRHALPIHRSAPVARSAP
jgi:hypothetical protein